MCAHAVNAVCDLQSDPMHLYFIYDQVAGAAPCAPQKKNIEKVLSCSLRIVALPLTHIDTYKMLYVSALKKPLLLLYTQIF